MKLKVEDLLRIAELLNSASKAEEKCESHNFGGYIGKKVIVRTFSAGGKRKKCFVNYRAIKSCI